MAIQASIEQAIIPVPSIHIRDATTAQDYDRVDRLMRDWISNIENRYGLLREQYSEKPTPDLKELLDKDRITKNQYKDILNGIRHGVDKLIKPYRSDLSADISHVADFHLREIVKEPQTHAVATYKIHASAVSALGDVSLMVGFLATAPWNLTMYAANEEHFESLKTPGSGAIMLKSLVEKALASGCRYLYLKPLDESAGFYHHMGMTHNPISDYFHLDLRLKISAVFERSQAKFLCLPNSEERSLGAVGGASASVASVPPEGDEA